MGSFNERGIRLFGALIASLYSIYYLNSPTSWHFIDYVNLIFHEAGHVIFMFGGQFISIAMGSGLQILLPLSITLYFYATGQKLSAAICLMWTGFNFINVSVYAGDAIVMNLPLLGGDSVIHDWNYLLSNLNLLSSTPLVASLLYFIGVLCTSFGIACALFLAINQSEDQTLQSYK
jgi:hypothetical protein